MTDIDMRQLLKAGVHFGHQTRYWSPSMAPYIFGDRNKIHIINLEKTLPMLKEAMNYLGSVAAQGGKVLFVGTKRQAGKLVREHATRCGAPFVDHRWLGGMLTNYKTVKNSIARLKELEERIDSGATARLRKKEALSIERERLKLDKTLSGIKDMNGLPDAIFIIDVEHEYIAVAEANKLGIPVVAVVDSNCKPEGVDYIIPGNDDSTKAIQLYLQAAADAVLEAKTASRSATVIPGDDEYVEVDESGEIVASEAAVAAEGVVEAEAAPPQDKKEESAESSAQDAGQPEGEKAATVEKVAKKVAKKKVVKKKVTKTAQSDQGDEGQGHESKKKKITKKKVVKKKAAKKKIQKESGEQSRLIS